MRIVHVTWGYPSFVNGHEATYFANQVESLAKVSGVDIKVVAPITWVPRLIAFSSPRWQSRMNIPSEYKYNKIQVYRPRFIRLIAPKNSSGSDLLLLSGVIRRQLIELRPDLVHIHGATSFGLAALKAAKSLSFPTVLTLHGGDVNYAPFLSKRHYTVFFKAMQMSDKCIAVSSELAEKAQKMSGVDVFHVPIGIDTSRFTTEIPMANARDKFELPQKVRIVLYLGNLLQSKGVQVMLDALEKSGSEVLGVFAGEGPMVSNIMEHPHAKWIGPVNYMDVPTLISAANILVLPSFNEGLPTVVIEAGALRVPVIGTSVGGIPSLLSNQRGYLIPVNDPLALSKAIAHVFENQHEAHDNSKRLYDFVKKYYDADVNSANLIKIYKHLI